MTITQLHIRYINQYWLYKITMKSRIVRIKREIEKIIFYDNCVMCKKEITGYSEKQVTQRMGVHLLGCNEYIRSVEKEEQK